MHQKHSVVGAMAVLALAACAATTTTGLPAGPDGSAMTPQPTMTIDPLDGTSWRLTSGPEDGPELGDFDVTTAFADGHASGRAPVNQYSGAYELHDDSLRITDVASTRMAGEPAAMEAESHFFGLLAEVASFEVVDSRLDLRDDRDEVVLTYELMPDPAQEPTDQQTAAAEEFAKTLVGQSEEKAAAATEAASFEFRVVSRNGEPLPGTADYRTDRINVAVEDGVISAISVG